MSIEPIIWQAALHEPLAQCDPLMTNGNRVPLMGSERPVTIALHAVHAIGAGHLARQTALARYLRAHQPGLAPVILSSGPAVEDICGEVPAMELPSALRMHMILGKDPVFAKLAAATVQIWFAALASLRPKVVVHDTLVWPPLLRAAALLGARQALCLRPRKDLAKYLAKSLCPLREMDLVFVPDDPGRYPDVHSTLEEAGVEAIWTGPIFRTATATCEDTRLQLGVPPSTLMVVVVSGAGSGTDSQRHFLDSLAALRLVSELRLSVVVTLGPLFTSTVAIPEHFPHALFIARSGDLPNILAAADLVLCRGGYGSLHEATAGDAAVLATPAARDYDDQETRIKRFAAETTCELADNVSPQKLAAQITGALWKRSQRQATGVRSDALSEVGKRLVKLARQNAGSTSLPMHFWNV